jgi:ethanolamine utilization protein EutP
MHEKNEIVSSLSKPIMVIGPTGSGKSTLLKVLDLVPGDVKKTESIVYAAAAIDTPGEMMHIPFLYNALILNSARASLALFLVSAKRPVRLPAKIALALKAPAIGVISQIDDAAPDGIAKARAALEIAGLKTIFPLSSVTGEGLAVLGEFLLKNNKSSLTAAFIESKFYL